MRIHGVRTGIVALASVIVALAGGSSLRAQGAAGAFVMTTVGGGLLVAPTRLVFEGRVRNAELSLVNTGSDITTYRIEFVRLRMREDGSFENVDAAGPGERFSDELVRYSPRQVTLEPGVPQAIRL